MVNADGGLVELAVRVALRNACEAVRELGCVHAADAPIVIAWDTTDTDIWVAVIDRGTGIAPGLLDPFEFAATTKDEGVHFGVGLALARRAAQSLGGTAAIRSDGPRGITFTLRWPLR